MVLAMVSFPDQFADRTKPKGHILPHPNKVSMGDAVLCAVLCCGAAACQGAGQQLMRQLV